MAKQVTSDVDCSIFVGNLDQRVSEEVLWELFLQAGPIKSVRIPCDKETGKQKLFGFVEFSSSAAAHYAWELLDGIRLYNRPLTVRLQQPEIHKRIPSNVMSAIDFYNDFYKKYEDLKRRPQSEPRRNRLNEENSHQRNSSFSHPTLNRSLSSPAHMANSSPQLQQLLDIIGTRMHHNLNTSTPYRGSPSVRIPCRGSSPYAGSPPYVGSQPYARPPPYAGSPPYPSSPLSDAPYRGYPLPRQSPYRR